MDSHTVIARAFRGEPLKRVLIEVSDRSAYLANPDLLDAVISGHSMPVGFPIEDIYLFEKEPFFELSAEWESAGKTRDHTWGRLRRFRVSSVVERP